MTGIRRQALSLVVLTAVAAATFAPVAVVVYGGLDVEAWRDALGSAENRAALGYSVILALRAPFAAVIGFVIAWILIRFPIPGRRFLEFSFWIAFMMPVLPLTLGWILFLDEHDGLLNKLLMQLPFIESPPFDIHSIAGILWVHMTASTVPVMIILLGPAIRQMDSSLEEAARVSGAPAGRVLYDVTLPLLFTAILTGTILGFIRGLEAFEVEQLLGAPADIYVYTTRVFDLANWQPPRFAEAMALSTLVLVMLGGLAFAHQRTVRGRSYATVVGRGMGAEQLSIGRARYLLSAALFLLVGASILLPTMLLIVGSFMTLFGFFDIAEPFTMDNWHTVLEDRNFLLATRNSLVIALGAGLVGALLYTSLAYLIMRTRLAYRPVLDFMSWLPWCVPGILLGLGLLALVLFTPVLGIFYGSLGLLIAAVIISQFPLGVNMMKAAVGQVGMELEEAATVSGAGRLRVFYDVILPLVRPMLISVFVLVVIAGLRDISTLVLLAQPRSLPLSILLFEYAISGSKEAAAVVGLIISAIVLVVALTARRFGLSLAGARDKASF